MKTLQCNHTERRSEEQQEMMCTDCPAITSPSLCNHQAPVQSSGFCASVQLENLNLMFNLKTLNQMFNLKTLNQMFNLKTLNQMFNLKALNFKVWTKCLLPHPTRIITEVDKPSVQTCKHATWNLENKCSYQYLCNSCTMAANCSFRNVGYKYRVKLSLSI